MAGALLGGLLDRVVLVTGTVLGGCLPGFAAQYRQRVGGRLDQVEIDLQPFRDIAARFHGGSMDALIQHHLRSPDNTFHAEGQAIQSMVDSELRLRAMFEALQGSVYDQLAYLAVHVDRGIARATWDSFIPAFNLEASSIVIAATVGVALWLLFIAIWRGAAGLLSSPRRRPRPISRAAP
jgi:hypothetical protein